MPPVSRSASQAGQIDLFLCHAKVDSDWVRELAQKIENEEWNGRRLKVAFDEWDIAPGQNVILRLSELLERSRFIGVVLSPELVDSEWCAMEWTAAKHDDPAGLRGRLIPLLLRTTDTTGERRLEIPYALRPLHWLNFTGAKNFLHEYTRLLCRLRNQPLPRGRGASPQAQIGGQAAPPITAGLPVFQEDAEPVEELLLSNLLPVIGFPATIWSAPTILKTGAGFWAQVTDPEEHKTVPPFILREGRVYSFAPLPANAGALARFLHPGSRTDPVGQWRRDQDRWRWYIDLAHRCLQSFARGTLHLFHEKEKRRYFFAPQLNGAARIYRSGKTTKRTVAKPCQRPDGSTFWVHQACRMGFESLGERLFLGLQPCWVFTVDGKLIMSGREVGPLSTKWSGHERNGTILRHVLFWSRVLATSKGKIEIPTGGEPFTILREPTRTRTPVGVACDIVQMKALLHGGDDDLDAVAREATLPDEEDTPHEE